VALLVRHGTQISLVTLQQQYELALLDLTHSFETLNILYFRAEEKVWKNINMIVLTLATDS
jgi:hypothetical protein